jgi:hypothetical protein
MLQHLLFLIIYNYSLISRLIHVFSLDPMKVDRQMLPLALAFGHL